MAHDELQRLLARLDGSNDPAGLDAVRALLARYEREFPLPLGDALRDEAGDIDVAEVVDAVISLDPGDGLAFHPGDGIVDFGAALREEAGEIDIGGDVLATIMRGMPVAKAVRADLGSDVQLSEAVHGEAGTVEIADPVLDEAGLSDPRIAIAEAIADEAGTVDVADAVMAALGVEKLPIAAAVADEAGPVPAMWAEVALAIGIAGADEVEGWDGALLGEAVRAEAGDVDVVVAVMGRIQRTSLASAPNVPAPANRGWTWGALALAAVAVFSIVLGDVWFGNDGTVGAPVRTDALASLSLATPDEIRIDDLSYGENTNVQVITTDGADATTIIWVDGETL